MPFVTRRVRDNNSTVHAARGKAAEALRGADKAAGRKCRSVPLQVLRSFWWQPVMSRERYTYSLRVGDAEVSRGAVRVTRALDGDGQSLRYGLSVGRHFDQPCANSQPPAY